MSTTKDELLAALASVDDDMTHPTTVALIRLVVGWIEENEKRTGAYINYLEAWCLRLSAAILVEKDPSSASTDYEAEAWKEVHAAAKALDEILEQTDTRKGA